MSPTASSRIRLRTWVGGLLAGALLGVVVLFWAPWRSLETAQMSRAPAPQVAAGGPAQETGQSRRPLPTQGFTGTLAELHGRVFSPRPIYVFTSRSLKQATPDPPRPWWSWRRWRRWVRPKDLSWFFRGRGGVVIAALEPAGSGATEIAEVQLRFVPRGDTLGARFRVELDGALVFARPVVADAEGLLVRLPRERLAVGAHDLVLVRLACDGTDAPAVAGPVSRFTEIAYRLAPKGSWRPLSQPSEGRLVGDLVETGVTGAGYHKHAQGREKQSGFIAVGRRKIEAEIANPRGARRFRVSPQNTGPGPARFVLRSGDPQVPEARVALVAGDRTILEVPVAGDPVRLEMEVHGPAGEYLWGAPALTGAEGAEGDPPPIVLITLDTTRRDSLSPYGAPPGSTPHLARLAAEGTLYESAWAVAPWTLPSHASMFTGLYPSHHGAGVASDRLPRQLDTTAELLRQAGYRTAGFVGGGLSAFRFGVAQGFSRYRDPDGISTSGDRLSAYVLDYLEEIGEDPFFLFLNFFDAHAPHQAPAAFEKAWQVAELRERLPKREPWKLLARSPRAGWRRLRHGPARPGGRAREVPAARRYFRAVYQAEVAFMDAQVGRVLEDLRRRGIYDRAMIVVVADHGELLGEGGLYGHSGRLDAALVQVPLIVKWPAPGESTEPAFPPPGARRGELVSQVDLFSTVLEVAGVEAPPREGHSLLAPPLGRSRQWVLSEEHESVMHDIFGSMRVDAHLWARQDRGHREIVWTEGGSCAALAAPEDPGSWAEISCREPWEDILAELQQVLGEAPRAAHGPGGLSNEDRDALRALGYLGGGDP